MSYQLAPCDPNGPQPDDAAIADQLNSELQADMRGYMDDYRVCCARKVVQTVASRELDPRAAVIAVTTVIVETHIQNISEMVDHDSLGLFQQRASWGSREQRLDPRWATNAFIDKMLREYPSNQWMHEPIGDVCQAVQVSAYPDRYRHQAEDARIIVDRLSIGDDEPGGPGPGPYTVTAWARANVRNEPNLNGDIVSYVVNGGSYPASCWVTGDTVTAEGITNDVWVKLPLNAGGYGYVTAIYLKGDERGNLPESATC